MRIRKLPWNKRNQFDYYCIKATERREIQKPFFIKEFLPKKDELDKIVITLWEKPQQDYQYFSQDIV